MSKDEYRAPGPFLHATQQGERAEAQQRRESQLQTTSVSLTEAEITYLQKVLRVVEAYPDTKSAILVKLAAALEQFPHERKPDANSR